MHLDFRAVRPLCLQVGLEEVLDGRKLLRWACVALPYDPTHLLRHARRGSRTSRHASAFARAARVYGGAAPIYGGGTEVYGGTCPGYRGGAGLCGGGSGG
eukprot:954335-Rhodomonas_salina.1